MLESLVCLEYLVLRARVMRDYKLLLITLGTSISSLEHAVAFRIWAFGPGS